MTYNKTFKFGKITYNKQKTNPVELEVTLKQNEKKQWCFSASGNIWNTSHTDLLMGGQCIDDIYKEFANQIENPSLYKKIMKLWEKWHLNDLNAGCEHQRALKWDQIKLDNKKPLTQDNMATWTYKKDNPRGLLAEPCPKCGYKYGTEWKFRAINKEDMRSILSLLDVPATEMWAILKNCKN